MIAVKRRRQRSQRYYEVLCMKFLYTENPVSGKSPMNQETQESYSCLQSVELGT